MPLYRVHFAFDMLVAAEDRLDAEADARANLSRAPEVRVDSIDRIEDPADLDGDEAKSIPWGGRGRTCLELAKDAAATRAAKEPKRQGPRARGGR